jgi:predicted permease
MRTREWIDRLLGTLRLRRGDADLEAELRAHAELAAEADGRSPRIAVTQAMDAVRDRRGLPWLHALSSDVVCAWRQLRTRPVVSVAAILSLALAIGATTAAFRLVDAILLRQLPIAEPDRLSYAVTWYLDAQGRFDYYDQWDYPTYRRYLTMVGDRADLLVIGSSSRIEAAIGGAGEPERVSRQFYSGNVFGVFGLRPALGRLIGPADDRIPGGHPIVVLAHDFWQRRFGGDAGVLGTIIRVGAQPFEVIGVAPAGFAGTEPGRPADLFMPAVMNVEPLDKPGWGWFQLWVRPRPEVPAAVVQQILHADQVRDQDEEIRRLPADTPQRRIDALRSRRVDLQPAAVGASALQKNYRVPLLVLGALVAVVLFIACVNVANLLDGQALVRRREMALRVAIGAGRWRLIRLMLVESAMLAALASAAGAAFGWWAAPFVVSLLSSDQEPLRLALGIDWRSTLFGAGLTAIVTVLFGTLPAMRAAAVAPGDALRSGSRVTGPRRLTHALIGAQAAFCAFVVFVAVLLVTTFARLATQPLGFLAESLLTVNADAGRRADGHARWLAAAGEVRALPGVESVALAGWPLLAGNRWRWDVRVPGRPAQPDPPYFLSIAPGFFRTMELPLLEGRDLRAGDVAPDRRPDAVPRHGVAIVNQAFARTYFDGRSPVGERVTVEVRPGVPASIEIVGLAGDAAYAMLRDPIRPTVYVPAEYAGGAALMVRTAGDPDAVAPLVRRTLSRARPDARLRLVVSQTNLVKRQLVRERLLATLAGFVGAVALLLAGSGLYGVLHHAVVRQQRPIGIRMALGARAGQVVAEVTASLLAAVAGGAAIGLGAGVLFGRAIENLLFRIGATDAGAIAPPMLVLAVTAAIAALSPAIRAARIDPASTLRAE